MPLGATFLAFRRWENVGQQWLVPERPGPQLCSDAEEELAGPAASPDGDAARRNLLGL